MSELVANCPRCGAKEMTFDLVGVWGQACDIAIQETA